MNSRKYEQCTRCVMDTSDPAITFDDAGRCSHCTDYLTRIVNMTYRASESDRKLDEIVDRIGRAGKGKQYDCVIGVSGGVDSSYVAYEATRRGLRCLAVHMDNGWDSDIAVRNVKSLASTLGMDYQSHVLDWGEFKDLQLAFLKASVPEIETPTDIAIPAVLHRAAAENGVRFVISGGNYATEGILPSSWHYDAKDVRFLRAIHRRYGQTKLKTFPTFGFPTETYYKVVRRVRIIYLLNHVPYAKQTAIDVLATEVGWRPYGGKHHESTITRFVQSFVLPEKFGIDYRRATLSTQICAGEITREQALVVLEDPPYESAAIATEKEYIAKKFGLTVADLDDILDRAPRTYADYPNRKRLLKFIYGSYRGVGRLAR